MSKGDTDNGKRVLMIANPGGHLQQLHMLDGRLPFTGERLWVTADTAQARSLLQGQEVRYLRDVGPRDYVGLAACLVPGWKLLRSADFEAVVSTGAGMALTVFPSAAMLGIPAHYIESATRTNGASFSGRILQRVPRVHLYTQHEQWADRRWSYPGSVFDGFERIADSTVGAMKKVVVSVGTQRGYGFRRLVEKLLPLLPPDAEVLWQTGSTDTSGLPIEPRVQVASRELEAAISTADLVVAHAGTGIALTAFLAGKSPVLVPRERAHGEHVDDHQTQTADLLDTLQLAVVRRLDQLDSEALELSRSYRIVRRTVPAPLALAGSHVDVPRGASI